jgi:hypothetical protein
MRRPSGARLLGCAGVCFFLLGASAAAAAEQLSVSLRYSAGSPCPDAAAFKSVVAARLGYDPFRAEAVDHVSVRITSQEGELDGRIEWRDAQGKWAGDQTFPSASADCSRLARAMGLALAVQIQLLAGTRAGTPVEPSPVPAPPTESGPAGTGSPPPRAPVVPPVSEPPVLPAVTEKAASSAGGAPRFFALGAGPALGLGLSSRPVALGRIFAGIVWPRLSLEIGAQASLPTTTRRDSDRAGFSQWLMAVTTAACAGGTRWNGCLLMAAGAVHMAGKDIDIARSAWAPIVSAGARIGYTQRLGQRSFLYAHADGLANVVRWAGELDMVPAWTAPPFAAALGIDAGIRFP